MSIEVKSRIKRVAFAAALFFLAGLGYAAFVHFAGFGIPCFFHVITGLRCPGCGMTHAAMSILHFDLWGAVKANAFLIPIGLYVGWLLFYTLRRYIVKGILRLDSGSKVLDIAFLASLLIWSVARNIIGI